MFRKGIDSYATRLPIPAPEKFVLKEKKVEPSIRNPFEETPKVPLPATLPSEDSDKEPFGRALTYENMPPRYPTYPMPEPAVSYQSLPPPMPPGYGCQPNYRPVYPNAPPAHTLRPLQPPPLNNCCARCDRGCKRTAVHAQRKAFVAKTKNETSTLRFFNNLDFNNPNECTSKQLKTIIRNNAAVNMTIAKEVIQRTAEKELGGGIFHVICSSADLEYTTRTLSFCFGEVADGVCYLFRTN